MAGGRRGRQKSASPDPTRPLPAPRRELFCCYAARLGNLTDAYLSANYTCASRGVASRNASRLRSREPGIADRIEYLSKLDDAAFEQAFAAAKARVYALDQAEAVVPDTSAVVSAASKEAAPDTRCSAAGMMAAMHFPALWRIATSVLWSLSFPDIRKVAPTARLGTGTLYWKRFTT